LFSPLKAVIQSPVWGVFTGGYAFSIEKKYPSDRAVSSITTEELHLF